MSIFSMIFGNSDGYKRSQQALLEAEDRLMEIRPGEERNLSVHVEAEEERTKVLMMRLRNIQIITDEKSDRNWWTIIIIGAILFAKGGLTIQQIAHFFLTGGFQ